jgi:hypothetical protein
MASKRSPRPDAALGARTKGNIKKRTSGFRTDDIPETEWVTFKPPTGPAASGSMSKEWKIFPASSSATLAAFSKAPTAPVAGTASRRRYEATALNPTNIWRERNGLPPLTFSLSPEAPPKAPAADAALRRRYEDALDQINSWRERNNLPPLRRAQAGKAGGAKEELDPVSALREECARAVVNAIQLVDCLKEMAPFVIVPKDYRAIVEADAAKLREVALHGYGISEELLHMAAMLDNRVAAVQPRIGAMARDEAVKRADQLLTQFADDKVPELTKGRQWNKLSSVLFGVDGADMWEAMRRYKRTSRP